MYERRALEESKQTCSSGHNHGRRGGGGHDHSHDHSHDHAHGAGCSHEEGRDEESVPIRAARMSGREVD